MNQVFVTVDIPSDDLACVGAFAGLVDGVMTRVDSTTAIAAIVAETGISQPLVA